MRSARSITANILSFFVFFTVILVTNTAFAQENSPYSRYAAGDIVNNRNILNRGMGGITTAYADSLNQAFGNSINLNNPAALGSINRTMFELAGEVSGRTLRSNTSPEKYNSVNTNMSYLQLAVPLSGEEMRKKGNGIGLSFGLRPFSRVDYKITGDGAENGLDTINTLYSGSGGVNMANVSLGVKIKSLSLGLTGGYMFGNKQINTEKRFIYDTVAHYNSSREAEATLTGAFFGAGLLYDIKMDSGRSLRFGLSANFKKNLTAKSEILNRTIGYDANGSPYSIDTVSYVVNAKGTMVLPATYSLGFLYTGRHIMFGADFDLNQWDDYRYYGETDKVKNNWTIRVGAQYFPAEINTPVRKYWNFVKYRAGFYYGPDYININTQRPEYAATIGAGFPLTRLNNPDLVTLNTAIEVGGRGNKENVSVRESFARFSIGISMSARWFVKRKYYE